MVKQDKDIELRSEEVQDVMGEVPPVIVRWGITVIFLVVAILLVGSFIFKYPDVVTATVTITTEEPPACVIARATGKIDEIFVHNNQPVKKDTPLGVIQNPANTADMLLLIKRIAQWKGRNQDLLAGREIFNDQQLQLGSVQSSYAAFLSSLREEANFRQLQYYPQKITLQVEQAKKQKQNLSEMRQKERLMRLQLETVLSIFRRDSLLYNKGVISEESYDSSKSKLLQSHQELSSLRSSIKQAELEITQCAGSMLDLQQQYQENGNKNNINLLMAIDQLSTDIKSWERNFLLVSPIDGVVNLMGYWSDNQNVETGETLFTVLPASMSSPIGKALLPVQGSGKVKPGQRVNVRLNNFPNQEFGYLEGIVKNISNTPDSKSKYVVEIRFPKGLTTNYGKKLPVTRQMEGSAEIITQDIRLIERFFNPIKMFLKKNT